MVADGMPRLAVAYSGGLDSRFLCYAAARAGASVLALHCHGPHKIGRASGRERVCQYG